MNVFYFHFVVDLMLAATAIGSSIAMYIINGRIKVMHDRVAHCHSEVVRLQMREACIMESLKSVGIEMRIEEVDPSVPDDHRRKMN